RRWFGGSIHARGEAVRVTGALPGDRMLQMISVRRAVHLAAAATMLSVPFDGARAQPETGSAEADAQVAAHIDNARRLAGTDLTAPFDFFCVPGNARPNDFSAPPLEPVKLFDNLYALGNSETVVYAI